MSKRYKELGKLSLYLLSILFVVTIISFEAMWSLNQVDIEIEKESIEIDLKQYVDKYKDTNLERYIGREIIEDLYEYNPNVSLNEITIGSEHSFSDLDGCLIVTDDDLILSGEITNSIIVGPIDTMDININHSLIIGINNSFGDVTFDNSLVYFESFNSLYNIKYVNNSLLGLLNFKNTAVRGYEISPNNSYIDVKTI